MAARPAAGAKCEYRMVTATAECPRIFATSKIGTRAPIIRLAAECRRVWNVMRRRFSAGIASQRLRVEWNATRSTFFVRGNPSAHRNTESGPSNGHGRDDGERHEE